MANRLRDFDGLLALLAPQAQLRSGGVGPALVNGAAVSARSAGPFLFMVVDGWIAVVDAVGGTAEIGRRGVGRAPL